MLGCFRLEQIYFLLLDVVLVVVGLLAFLELLLLVHGFLELLLQQSDQVTVLLECLLMLAPYLLSLIEVIVELVHLLQKFSVLLLQLVPLGLELLVRCTTLLQLKL